MPGTTSCFDQIRPKLGLTNRLTNDLLCHASMEEVQPVIDFFRQATQVEPDVERRVRDMIDLESHIEKPPYHVIPLVAEMGLQCLHFVPHLCWFEHGDSCFLKWNVCPAVKIRSTRSNRFDELFWAQDPGYALHKDQRNPAIGKEHTQPGRRKRFVSPSMISTSSSSTLWMLSAAETTLPSQLEV